MSTNVFLVPVPLVTMSLSGGQGFLQEKEGVLLEVEAFRNGGAAMEWYYLMVSNGGEARFKELAEEILAERGIRARLYFFRRKFCRRPGSLWRRRCFPAA